MLDVSGRPWPKGRQELEEWAQHFSLPLMDPPYGQIHYSDQELGRFNWVIDDEWRLTSIGVISSNTSAEMFETLRQDALHLKHQRDTAWKKIEFNTSSASFMGIWRATPGTIAEVYWHAPTEHVPHEIREAAIQVALYAEDSR